jgi:hypothetical protein
MDNLKSSTSQEAKPRKDEHPYETPAVVYEAMLEVRAGTPPDGGIPNPLDLTGSSGG